MQDKEIDHLFRSQLENVEVEPSAQVWGNIEAAVNAKKGRRNTYFGVAASLLILLSAGLYFINRPVETVTKSTGLVKLKKQEPVKQGRLPEVIKAEILKPETGPILAVSRKPAVHRERATSPVRKEVTIAAKPETITQPETQQLAQVTPPAPAEVKFTVPDQQMALAANTNISEETPFKTSTDLAPQLPEAKTIAAAPAKKHRIRSLGDLINVVVNKVDKRKDKLIEFSSDKDEDETVVSGLNLGFIKIKREAK